MLASESFSLQDEFNKRINRLSDANHFRIKQLSNFIKYYDEDKKTMVDCFKESFITQKDEIPKIMFECLTDVISSTFFKDRQNEDSYQVLFSKLLLTEFNWMAKKFRTKQQIEVVSSLIKSWSEKKWGPCKEAIYQNEFTEYLSTLLTEHKINMDDQSYINHLDDTIYYQYLSSKTYSFIMNGLKNDFIKQFMNLDIKDKALEYFYRQNVNIDEFMKLINDQNPDTRRRKMLIMYKYKPIFIKLKELIIRQITSREIFIRKLLTNRNELYKEYEKYLAENK